MTKSNKWIQGSFYNEFHLVIDQIGVAVMIKILSLLYQNQNIELFDWYKTTHVPLSSLFITMYSDINMIRDIPITQTLSEILQIQS